MIAFHITNRFLNLEPVLASLADQAEWAGFRYDFFDLAGGKAFDEQTGETVSSWVLMASDPAHLGTLNTDTHLRPLRAPAGQRVWTDDYSNLLSVFDWRF